MGNFNSFNGSDISFKKIASYYIHMYKTMIPNILYKIDYI